MRLIGRIAVILAAALVVVGATVAFSKSSLAANFFPTGPGRGGFAERPEGGEFTERFSDGSFDGQTPPTLEGERPARGEGEFRAEGRRGGVAFSLFALLRHAAVIALIVLVVAGGGAFIGRFWPRKRRVTSASPPEA